MSKEPKQELTWKRGVRDEIETSVRMTWDTHCGEYRVQESVSKLGLGTTYYAICLPNTILSNKCRKKSTAQQLCQEHKNGLG